jgi:diguanylate cyclase (GGDEF)-like protein/PAS domain S-box-containing protein
MMNRRKLDLILGLGLSLSALASLSFTLTPLKAFVHMGWIILLVIFGTVLYRLLGDKRQAEEAFAASRENLEDLVEEQTAELRAANILLKEEIAERRQIEEALRNSERFLNTIFESIRDPFSIVDRDYRIIRANKAYARMRHKPLEGLIGRRCYEVLQGRTSVCEHCAVEKSLKSGDPCAKDKLLTFPSGGEVWEEIYTYPIVDEKGQATHVIEYTRDITNRKKSEGEKERLIEKLKYLSAVDGLTGLLNRRALMERLEHEVARARRYGSELSILLGDMDHFKEINDTYGHEAGDEVLRLISGALAKTLRETDVSGRYGGDEFMVIVPETSMHGAEHFAERIRMAIENADLVFCAQPVTLSMSMGIAIFHPEDDANSLMKRADIALYASKRAGGRRVHASGV